MICVSKRTFLKAMTEKANSEIHERLNEKALEH